MEFAVLAGRAHEHRVRTDRRLVAVQDQDAPRTKG
jgi:hypothetical protein